MIDFTIMAKTNQASAPNCAGCDYLDETDWTCDHIGHTGKSRIKMGANIFPGGGCRAKRVGGRNVY